MIKCIAGWADKKIKKAKAFFMRPDIQELVNECKWEELAEAILRNDRDYTTSGIIWSSIYTIHPAVYEELGYIPYAAFAYTDIEEIQLPDNIKRIGHAAFYKSRLNEIHFGRSVEDISTYALLTNCVGHLEIYFDGTYKEWRAIKKDANYVSARFEKRGAYLQCSDKEDIRIGSFEL